MVVIVVPHPSGGEVSEAIQIFTAVLNCLAFLSQCHPETLAPAVDSGFHCDTNSMGISYSGPEWGGTALGCNPVILCDAYRIKRLRHTFSKVRKTTSILLFMMTDCCPKLL